MTPTGKVSLTQKYLPAACWTWLSKKTSFGTTVYDCAKSALENPDSNVGLYAPDPEAYDLFAELFHPVIGEYHKVDVATLVSVHDLGDAANLRDLPQNYQDAIVSTRVRVGRTVRGYPMAGKLTKEKRIELEHKVRDALVTLDGDLAGTYRSLVDMSKEEKDALIEEHILYNDGEDRFLASAGGYNDWPTGRGIYMNNDKNFIVWVNEEDHIRIISMQKGASLKQVWGRLVRAIHAMETRLDFVCHPKFGHLTFCPTNIGTGLRASVHVKVPKTAESGKLDTICAAADLQPRGVNGEHTESVGGVYDISNKIRIGRTEWDLINTMWIGVEKLLDNELGNSTTEAQPTLVLETPVPVVETPVPVVEASVVVTPVAEAAPATEVEALQEAVPAIVAETVPVIEANPALVVESPVVEASAPILFVEVPAPVVESTVVEAPVVEIPVPVVDAPAQVPVVEAPAPAPVVESPVVESPVVESSVVESSVVESLVVEAPAPVPVVEIPVPVVEAPAPVPVVEAPAQVPVVEAPAPAPVVESLVEGAPASAPVVESPVVEAPAPAPVVESPVLKAPVVESPLEEAPALVPVVETPAPVVEAPVSVVESLVSVSQVAESSPLAETVPSSSNEQSSVKENLPVQDTSVSETVKTTPSTQETSPVIEASVSAVVEPKQETVSLATPVAGVPAPAASSTPASRFTPLSSKPAAPLKPTTPSAKPAPRPFYRR